MEDLRNAMSYCANLLGCILTLTCYGVLTVAIHEEFMPGSRNGVSGGETVVEYTNTHSMGESALGGAPGVL